MKTSRAVEAHSPESSSAVALGYQPGWLVGNLPVVMQEDSFTARFVTIFEEIASTVRFAVESSADAADLSVTNAAMIDYLGRWLDTPGGNIDLPIATQRTIVQADAATVRARGTTRALTDLLEAVTGGEVIVSDPGAVYRDGTAPIDISPLVVELSQRGHLDDAGLVQLIRAETPAHLPIIVLLDGRDITDDDTAWGTTAERAQA
jgi:phage tail-like protein